MVFTTKTISNPISKISNESSNNIISEDHSFLIESLRLISEENKQFFLSMAKSNTSEILNEGIAGSIIKASLKKLDPKQIIINIIDAFIKLLDKIWHNIEALLLNLCNQDHIIKSFKNKIESIDYSINYPFERATYTNLGTSTSRTTYKMEMEKEYSNLIQDLSVFNQFTTYEKLYMEINRMKENIDMTDNFFDGVRGRVISGTNYIDSISEAEYITELYKFYRNNGYKFLANTELIPMEIREILDSYINFKKYIKIVKRDKELLKKDAFDIKRNINNIKIEDYINDSLDSKDVSNMFISVLQNKAIRIKKICDIFTMSFNAKIDAIKEKQIQDREILFYVCKEITRMEGL